MAIILATAYAIGFLGFVVGLLIILTTGGLSKRFHGTLLGFTAGLLIAFVCFEMLPEAFEGNHIPIAILGILLGALTTAWFENHLTAGRFLQEQETGHSNMLKAGLLIAFAMILHKIPEGMAVGAMLQTDFQQGLQLSGIIAIHCIPEAIAVMLPLRRGGFRISHLFLLCACMGIPLAIGAFAGVALSYVSPVFFSLSLSFAGGVMIYVTCGEMIPESKDIWRGRLSTLGAILGFILGIMLTSYSV